MFFPPSPHHKAGTERMTVKSHASENYKQHFSAAYGFSLHTHTHTRSLPMAPSLSNIPDCVSVMSVSIHVCAETHTWLLVIMILFVWKSRRRSAFVRRRKELPLLSDRTRPDRDLTCSVALGSTATASISSGGGGAQRQEDGRSAYLCQVSAPPPEASEGGVL